MARFIVIASKDAQDNIVATWHDTTQMTLLEEVQVNAVRTTANKHYFFNVSVDTLESNKVHFYESDTESETERFFRNLGARKCDHCGKWIPPQDIHTSVWTGTARYCSVCRQNLPKTLEVFGYHGCPYALTLKKVRGEEMTMNTAKAIGIELEICSSSRTSIISNGQISCTDVFYEENKDNKRVWKIERDGSLNNGVEFISMPMSFAYAKAYDWSIITDQMKHLQCNDQAKESGMHVHVSKLCFGDDEKTQAFNALKLMYAMAIYENDFFKVSGRESKESFECGDPMYYCRFLEEREVHEIKEDLVRATSHYFEALPDEHNYCIINSGKTIEIRIFKSTSDSERIKHTLALIMGIVENIQNVPFEKIYCMRKLFKLVPQETMQYWRQRGCFLHTYANTRKGETL